MSTNFKNNTQKILNSQIRLEKEITKKVESLWDIHVGQTIKADYQQEMQKDTKDLNRLLESSQDADKDVFELKLIQEQIEEKATNIKLLEKGQGSFNILMLPFILGRKTKRNVEDRETEITNLKLLFLEALERQVNRIKAVEAKWPGINMKNGNDFNLFLDSELDVMHDAIIELS